LSVRKYCNFVLLRRLDPRHWRWFCWRY